jgi:hypothetical protein
VDASDGTLSATLGAGSRIQLTKGTANDGFLIFDDGTETNLQSFRLEVHDGRFDKVTFGGGSTLSVNLRSGNVGLGAKGFWAVGSGKLVATIQGEWDSSKKPDVSMDISILVA